MKKILVLLFIAVTFCSFAVAQTEYGTASYYGTYFHGRPTASGEKYNQFALTAAHKTLKLGTVVKVTNAQNNKSVIVKINDRGPFIKGRIIDLSTKAAEMLGYRNKGTAYVKIEVMNDNDVPSDLMEASADIAKENGIKEYAENDTAILDNSNSPKKDSSTKIGDDKVEKKDANVKIPANIPQPLGDIKNANSNGITNRSPYFVINKLDKNSSGFYGLQLGVFSDIAIIFAMMEELETKYKQNLIIQEVTLDGKKVYKLFIGKFQNRAYADALKLVLADKFKDSFVAKYD